MKDVHEISGLEQLRLLSDPLKLKLIQAFAEAESTVAVVADALGESQTKLYRHVDALLAAGLIEITREQPKRGTVERHFRAVAKRFEVADDLFSGDQASAGEDSIRELLKGAETELMAAMREDDKTVPPTFARFRARLNPEQLAELQERLYVWLDEAAGDESPADDAIEIGAIIALYRMPPD